MKMDLPIQVKWIIEQLKKAGFEAFAVGGCVRDMLLNKEPMDWDITTNAKPQQVKSVFRKTVDTGIEHGTVTVIKNGQGYEVTTYRVDGEYEDSRHPKEVIFTTDIKDDLCRRDFTINAMAYNEDRGFVDCFGGREDLSAHIIRCVGVAEERFTEDALRILRALRFASQLEFDIEEETYRAAVKLAKNIENVSVERIAVELIKLLVGKRPDRIKDVFDMGVMNRFYEHPGGINDNTIKYLFATKPVKEQRLAALFIGATTEETKKVLKNLKLDNDTIKSVSLLAGHIGDTFKEKQDMRRFLFEHGQYLAEELLDLQEAKAKAENDGNALDAVAKAREMLQEINVANDCVSYKDLAVNGKDLIALGVTPGKAIGDVLSILMNQVIEEPEKNNRDYLISVVNSYNKKFK